MEYNPKEFIKVFRKLINWEWYTDPNTKDVFIHCLLRANWRAGTWKEIHYEAGEFITSLPQIAKETGLSVQNVRTALDHLILTKEISSRSTDKVTGKKIPKGRIITINNWEFYQGDNRQSNRQSNREVTDKLTGKKDTFSKNLTGNPTGKVTDKKTKENGTNKGFSDSVLIASNRQINSKSNSQVTGGLTGKVTADKEYIKNIKEDKESKEEPAALSSVSDDDIVDWDWDEVE